MMNVYTTFKSRNKKFWQIFKRFLTNRDKNEDKDGKNGEKMSTAFKPSVPKFSYLPIFIEIWEKKKLSIFLFENPTGTFAWKGLIYLFFNLIKEQPLNTSNKTTHV